MAIDFGRISMTTKNVNSSNKIPLPYNSYNVFYILERERIIHERNGKQQSRESSAATEFNLYGPLDLPPLPPRYLHLESALSPNWYIPGARKLAKRKHVKSHGVASFREISRIVADNWKTMEPTTQHYVQAVATILKERHVEITREVQRQGMVLRGDDPNSSCSQLPLTVWQEMEQHPNQPTPSPVTDHRPNMMGVLPENFGAPLPYCGACDFSSDPSEPLALRMPMPTTLSQQIQTNHVSQNLCEQDILQMYLRIAASVSQQDVLPFECYNTTDQSFFCGECTH